MGVKGGVSWPQGDETAVPNVVGNEGILSVS